MIQYSRNSGFTLVELMLAMAFISILLMTIALTSMQIMGTYVKGITIREVNQAGRAITDDMQRAIAAAAPFNVSPKAVDGSGDPSSMYVKHEGGGRLCTGALTYAWNDGGYLTGKGSSRYNRYAGEKSDINATNPGIRLVRVSDAGGELCIDPTREIAAANARELLSAGDRNLAVQKFEISRQADGSHEASGQSLYAIKLILGTNNREGSKILNASSTSCLPPSNDGANEASDNQDFCAINQFDIIARAGNRSGGI